MAADDNYDDETIDELIANVPCATLESRTYYYTRYPGVEIRAKFQHTIALGLINIPKPVHVAGFGVYATDMGPTRVRETCSNIIYHQPLSSEWNQSI